ncbi:MAG TPA: hypothetical protein VM600_07865 [Actinomycetota bacterium]|nr:hypothetical protein [Actinomycetota bacterium]
MGARFVSMFAAAIILIPAAAWAHPSQHGESAGHLVGSGAWGDLELIEKAVVTDTNDLIADVAVSPDGNYAYLANWGRETCGANSEAGGKTDPDAGAYVIDIRDLNDPRQIAFIPHSQDSRPGEGMHALEVSTKHFTGTMLVMNNEQCGKNGKGGVSLVDVTNPRKPSRLSEHFGDAGHADTNDIHSAFAWDAGDRAYVVMADNFEDTDVDILDITNPKRPRLIADLNLNAIARAQGDPIDQPDLGLSESSIHDMIVKQIDGRWIMLLSYWDGGYVRLDVTDPASPVLLSDTDYSNPDPELFESTGISLPPEGNGHQAEFTRDDRFFIGTDEDFSPYRTLFRITSGPNAGPYSSGEFGWTVPVVSLPDKEVNGPTVFGGYGCPDDRASIPHASAVFPTVGPGEERTIVFQRGPVQDPSHNHEACFFSEKVESGQLAGYDAVIIANHHVGAQSGNAADAHICGGQGHAFTPTVPALCIGHRAMHLLFNSTPAYHVPYAGGEPAIGTVGEQVSAPALFDGWGYVHLFDAQTQEALDTYAIDEAHDPSFAFGFGDLSVHEVATDPRDARRAYLSYYSGGMRSLEIRCADPSDTSTCELVETGGYLDTSGNDFWGVEAFERGGRTIVLGSDRDSGLWIFEAH